MTYIYFARSMAAQTKVDTQTTPDNKVLHDTVVKAIRQAGHRPQFDITIYDLDKANMRADEYIYHRDMYWLERCHSMIVELSEPSTGVGFEIAWAKFKMGMLNILVLQRDDAKVSAMISGHMPIVCYRDMDELNSIIVNWLKANIKA